MDRRESRSRRRGSPAATDVCKGQREFGADKSTNLIASSLDDSTRFVWNNSEATKTLNVNTDGVYSVLATNKFNCSKRSDDISFASLLYTSSSP